MKSKKVYVSLAVLTLILTAGVASVSAYQGDYNKQGPNTDPVRHEAMQAALDGKDYNSWKELMNDKGRVAQVVNEENFSKFVEARRLGQSGSIKEADALRAELGLRGSKGERMNSSFKGGNGEGRGQGQGQGQKGQGTKGSDNSGNFIDVNGDGECDYLND